ncbi:MAG: hypothetical protein WBD56_05785, partial [Anaerolineales bacterium]
THVLTRPQILHLTSTTHPSTTATTSTCFNLTPLSQDGRGVGGGVNRFPEQQLPPDPTPVPNHNPQHIPALTPPFRYLIQFPYQI